VEALCLLNGRKLTTEDLDKGKHNIYVLLLIVEQSSEIFVADRLLIKFVEYWPEKCVMNIHSLLHLSKYVRYHGPLWSFWAFPFEKALGIVRDWVHGTKKVERQLSFGMNLLESLPILEKIFINGSENPNVSYFLCIIS
jgi:hypothetical protein